MCREDLLAVCEGVRSLPVAEYGALTLDLVLAKTSVGESADGRQAAEARHAVWRGARLGAAARQLGCDVRRAWSGIRGVSQAIAAPEHTSNHV